MPLVGETTKALLRAMFGTRSACEFDFIDFKLCRHEGAKERDVDARVKRFAETRGCVELSYPATSRIILGQASKALIRLENLGQHPRVMRMAEGHGLTDGADETSRRVVDANEFVAQRPGESDVESPTFQIGDLTFDHVRILVHQALVALERVQNSAASCWAS
jgi:hypothetical protein